MKKLIIVLLIVCNTVYAQRVEEPALIPQPYSMQILKGNFKVTKQLTLAYNDQEAIKAARLLNEFINANYGFSLTLRQGSTGAIVISHDPAATAESYSLNIQPNSIRLSGNPAGLFYGIQTLQQLFPVEKQAAIQLPTVSIKDQPRFAYRGLMLDVSRHFYSVSYVKKFLDQMSHYKLNTFHWHLTDDQGWRIEIKKYPALQKVSPGYYTQEEIKEIVAYAAARHIEVIPEIEMPGHSSAALAAYPWLGCSGGSYQVQTSWGIFHDVYCVGNDSVFTFLQDVIDEVVPLFPGRYVHIGGDECPKDTWKKCPKCQRRIADNHLKDEHELQSYLVQRIEKYINSKGRKMIGWDEILEGGLAPNATVMSWRGEIGGIEAARQKHEVIMTPYTYLYFDYYQGNAATEPKAIGGYLPLPAVYAYEPLSASLPKEAHAYIKGIQANTWTEYIATEDHLDYMVYPRALVVAETGWSPAGKKNYSTFIQKLRVRLAALDLRQVSFRIPEPVGLYDSVTTSNSITLNLQPSVKGAAVYYTTDGATPTVNSAKAADRIQISLTSKMPITVKTITVLPSGRQSAVYSASLVKKQLLTSKAVTGIKEGLAFKAAYREVSSAKQIDGSKADTTGTINSLAIAPFPSRSPFSAFFEGYFFADADGMYKFKVNADDGALLYLDDELVVDNDGLHAPVEKSGAVPLQKGYHTIRLQYFDAGGGRALNVTVAKNGLDYNLHHKLFH